MVWYFLSIFLPQFYRKSIKISQNGKTHGKMLINSGSVAVHRLCSL